MELKLQIYTLLIILVSRSRLLKYIKQTQIKELKQSLIWKKNYELIFNAFYRKLKGKKTNKY